MLLQDARPFARDDGISAGSDGGLSEGLIALDGFFRIYPAWMLPSWNAFEEWRFAWGDLAVGWEFVGGTAFGDQFARRASEQGVCVLDAYTLSIARHYDGIDELLRVEPALFLDENEGLIEAIVRRLGAPAQEEHVAFAPPPRITGDMLEERAMKLPRALSMILNGDVATQAERLVGRAVDRVETWIDADGRARLRLCVGGAS